MTQALMTVERVSANRKRRDRQWAKVGMGTALATLVGTALIGGRVLKQVHLVSGVALLGFTLWHWRLNRPGTRPGNATCHTDRTV
ncbi:hypothetical protein SIID45300_00476 [Candidatus Magnetaquicoccaceae bacterium FCR-1]|uniref:Uncharacterized protein n=1 Tax=Candidatus Magnetaquiglobus chichijimensis TaxID=3141448 RepID=A0ABQ0C5K7_9PROT